jgi:hypothetical protein
MYFQVWELDADQPRLSVTSRLAKLRHYRNLGLYRTLLPHYLQSAKFTSIADHAQAIRQSFVHGIRFTCETLRLPRHVANVSSRPGHRSQRIAEGNATLRLTPGRSRTGHAGHSVLQRRILTAISAPHNAASPTQTLANWDLKVLFVDDCSRDNTYEVLAKPVRRRMRTFGDRSP